MECKAANQTRRRQNLLPSSGPAGFFNWYNKNENISNYENITFGIIYGLLAVNGGRFE